MLVTCHGLMWPATDLCGENNSLTLAERADHLDFGSTHDVDLDLDSSWSGAFKYVDKASRPDNTYRPLGNDERIILATRRNSDLSRGTEGRTSIGPDRRERDLACVVPLRHL